MYHWPFDEVKILTTLNGGDSACSTGTQGFGYGPGFDLWPSTLTDEQTAE